MARETVDQFLARGGQVEKGPVSWAPAYYLQGRGNPRAHRWENREREPAMVRAVESRAHCELFDRR